MTNKIKYSFSVIILFMALSLPLWGQQQPIQDFLLETTAVVVADKGVQRMYTQVIDVDMDIAGYYRIIPKILYNSGDEQKNESFYLTVRRRDTNTAYGPENPNADEYFVVPDDPGPRHTIWRDAGLFYFPLGTSTIEMHHYARIADEYPQFLNGPISGPESIRIVDSLKLVAEPLIDASVEIHAKTKLSKMIDGKLNQIVLPGGTVDYTLIVKNNYINDVRFAKLTNMLPDSMTAYDFSTNPIEKSKKSLFWNLPDIGVGDSLKIDFKAKLADKMPAGYIPLKNVATLKVSNDQDSTNNYAEHIIYSLANQHGGKPDLYDVGISLSAFADSTIKILDTEYKAAIPGDTIRYSIDVQNYSLKTDHNLIVKTIPSEFLNIIDYSINPSSSDEDTLFWQIDSLTVAEKYTIDMSALLPKELPYYPYPLETLVMVHSDQDTLLQNNSDSQTVYGLEAGQKDQTDLAIKLDSITDTTLVKDEIEWNAVRPGDVYEYQLEVINNGPSHTGDIRAIQTIPDSVTIIESNGPVQQNENQIIWQVDTLSINQRETLSLKVQLSNHIDRNVEILESHAQLFAAVDTTTFNNFASDTVKVLWVGDGDDKIKPYDLEITHTASTDTTITVDNQTVGAVKRGNEFNYNLKITNNSPHTAYEFSAWALKPDSITFQDFSIAPTMVKDDSIFWMFDSLQSSTEKNIEIFARAADSMPYYPFEIQSFTGIKAENDTLADNNLSVTPVYVIDHTQSSHDYDVSIQLVAFADSTIQILDTEYDAMVQGDTLQYSMTVRNLSMQTQDNLLIKAIPSSFFALVDFSIEPTGSDSDTLFWEIDSLTADGKYIVNYMAILSSELPYYPYPLESVAQVHSEQDTFLQNNTAEHIVYGLASGKPQKTDLGITLASLTDTTLTDNGREINAVKPGEQYEYRLKVVNSGPSHANNIRIIQTLPDSVALTTSSIAIQQNANQIIWQMDTLSVNQSKTLSLKVQLSAQIDSSMDIIESNAQLFASSDTTSFNNFASDSVKVFREGGQDVKHQSYDLAISHMALTDTNIIIDNNTVKAVKSGNQFKYNLMINNNSPHTAYDFTAWMVIPDSITFENFSITPVSVKGDSVFWVFDSLQTESAINIEIISRAARSLPYYPYKVSSFAGIQAVKDTLADNNLSVTSVFIIHDTVTGWKMTDLALDMELKTGYTTIISGDTLKAIPKSHTYQQQLSVSNNHSYTAYHLTVVCQLPHDIKSFNATKMPSHISNDSLFWQFDSLPGLQNWQVIIDIETNDDYEYLPFKLTSRGEVSAANDTLWANNYDSKDIYVINDPNPPEPTDIMVSQYVKCDSFFVQDGDTTFFVKENETYDHYLIVTNLGNHTAYDIELINESPEPMQIIDTQPTANISQNQVITWYIEELLAQSSKVVQFKARLDNDMPVGTNYLPNTVIVSAINEDTTQLSNNKSILTLVNQVEQPPPTWQPEIKAFPARVDVTDSIFLSINVPVQVTEYDIIVSLPDGAINRAFADEFIQSHRILSPNQWYDIPKPYLPRHLVTERPEEEIIFKIKATDQFGQTKTAQTSVIVSSNNHLVLDRNVYRPELENPLKINFKLSYRRNAALDIYDLTGRHITQLTKDVYDGGWNTFLWDGRMENGIKAGSGVYLVTLRAGEYNSWKKFIIVR